jgi:hypothetical protein
MTKVTLTSGVQLDDMFVDLVMKELRLLEKFDNPTLLQLLMKCEDPKYRFLANAHHRLLDRRLLHSNYDVPDGVRDIVLCAVKQVDGDKGEPYVVSPTAS